MDSKELFSEEQRLWLSKMNLLQEEINLFNLKTKRLEIDLQLCTNKKSLKHIKRAYKKHLESWGKLKEKLKLLGEQYEALKRG
ncbi:hypothetical protein [Lysinibacillus sp. NPDC092081]|uniref:hypothetical protein n=1 Tax=Lysinibacillus sp. NPDC092081 TaxID=3364131 RepID=UPI00381978AA